MKLLRGVLILGMIIDGAFLLFAHWIVAPELTDGLFVRRYWPNYAIFLGMLILYYASTLRSDQ